MTSEDVDERPGSKCRAREKRTGIERRVQPFVLHVHAAHAVQRVHRLLDDLFDALELRIEEHRHVLHRFLFRVQDPNQIVAVLRRDRHARPVVVCGAVAAWEERTVRLHVGVDRVVEVSGPLVELADLEHIERLGERWANTLNAGRDELLRFLVKRVVNGGAGRQRRVDTEQTGKKLGPGYSAGVPNMEEKHAVC